MLEYIVYQSRLLINFAEDHRQSSPKTPTRLKEGAKEPFSCNFVLYSREKAEGGEMITRVFSYRSVFPLFNPFSVVENQVKRVSNQSPSSSKIWGAFTGRERKEEGMKGDAGDRPGK